MKPIEKVIIFLAITGLNMAAGSSYTESKAQNAGSSRIGTYDSRIVVIAYTRSDLFVQDQMKNRNADNEIMQSKDTVKKIGVFQKVLTEQYLLHQRGFSTGSASSVLNLVRDKLPQLAKAEGVNFIVSKWELTYLDPSIPIVDLTLKIASLFNPGNDFQMIADQMLKMDPIPLEDLPMDEVIQMWGQFEKKYLGK